MYYSEEIKTRSGIEIQRLIIRFYNIIIIIIVVVIVIIIVIFIIIVIIIVIVIIIIIVIVVVVVIIIIIVIIIVIVIIIILLSLEAKHDIFYNRSSRKRTPRKRKKLSVTGAENFKINTVNGTGAGRLRELIIS